MGDVYRARDERLGREVALKVLPENLSHDLRRMARFEREAQLLAALNHPNIATLYGLEESGGTRALAMELIEGPSLADRISQGPILLAEALPLARQIADALEFAHDHNIIHRDLKPANIKITHDGAVKVLDFGLAKALAEEIAPPYDSSPSSPTISVAASQAGHIVGTAAYMPPEQARGKPADRRADIWSFGVVLFEMLTGRQPFPGDTVSDALAAVIRGEPDWSLIPDSTPQRIRMLLRRCLEKEVKRRLQAIGEARIIIEEQISGAPDATPQAAASASPSARRLLPWLLAASLALSSAFLARLLLRSAAPAPAVASHFSIEFPAAQKLLLDNEPCLDVSRDGMRLAYVGTVSGERQLLFRALDRFEPAPLAGTSDAEGPFFSPDGNWVGFFSGGQLKKVSVKGGPVTSLAAATTGRGATWGPDDTIVFAADTSSGLFRVSSAGGTPAAVTRMEVAGKERTHRWPQFLPSGKAVLFTVGFADNPDFYDEARIDAVVLSTGERKTLLQGASMARYVSAGQLIFARGGGLSAVAFDPVSLRVTGSPVSLLEGVSGDLTTGAAHFAVAENGTLAYVAGRIGGDVTSLAWIDRQGNSQTLPLPAHRYVDPSLSPDGKSLALAIQNGREEDIWVYDFARGTLSRLTFGGWNRAPRWSPDGKKIVYTSRTPENQNDIYIKAADGGGSAELVSHSGPSQFVLSWSRDGKKLLMERLNDRGRFSLWQMPLDGDRTPVKLTKADFEERSAIPSPDGRWLAYVSDEARRDEVYVRPLDGGPGKWQISSDGGAEPRWAPNGRELFYRNRRENKLFSVPIEPGAKFQPGRTHSVFADVYHDVQTETDTLYDVAPDSSRVLMLRPAAGNIPSPPLRIVLNWFTELRNATAGTK